MKRKFLTVLLAVLATLCMAFALSACDFGGNGGASLPDLPKEGYSEEGLYFSLNADGRSYAVERGNWSGTDLVIPSLFNGAPVTSIGWHAFAGCEGLTEITIPESLTSIEEAAFDGCSGLKKVHVTDLATWCNISFLRLNSITPLYSNPLYYAHHLYMDGEEITKLEIPDSVVTIGEYVFSGCSGLTEVTIPDSVTSIGDLAFFGCSGLTEITIPDSVTSIGSNSFSECSGLTKITIPDSVTSIGIDSFYNTAYYNDDSNWTGDVLYIDHHLIKAKSTFSGSYSIRGGTKTIAGGVFIYCDGLTGVTIPDSVTSIGEYAFGECSALTEVTIPDSVTSIGNRAFAYCFLLESVTIPDSVTSIGEYAFWNCSELTEITIPDSVTSIGNFAFFLCTGLTSVTLGSSVTTIGEYAFSGCDKLTEVTIPDSVTSIGSDAFYRCSGLKKVYFKNPTGWKTSSYGDMSNATEVTGLNDPETAAGYLRNTYHSNYWKRYD